MELYLLRHGEAEPPSMAGRDEDRSLTARGGRDVRAVAELARLAGLQPQAIYTSPLLRARQTADILAEVFGVAATAAGQLASGPSLGDLQHLVSQSGRERVLFVGHEPHLSGAVEALTGGHMRMRTAGFAHVHAERLEPGAAILVSLFSPEFAPKSQADPPE